MGFWNKRKKDKPMPEEKNDVHPKNPFIAFELIDGVHLEITLAWPIEGDIKPFAHFLELLNTGSIIGPQLIETSTYAEHVGQPEKSMIIHAVLENIKNHNSNNNSPSDRPLVMPSKFMANQLKSHTG